MSDLYLTKIGLLNDVKENDEKAWNDFCQFYQDIIIGWAKNMGCSDAAARDVFQETMISLMKQFPDFDYNTDRGRFRSFIKTIVMRRVYDVYRKEKKYVNFNNDSEDNENLDISVLDKELVENSEKEEVNNLDLIWLNSLLKLAIKNVSKKVAPVTYLSFKLYVLEERPVEDVVKATGIDKIGTVYQHKSRFLSALKSEFYSLVEGEERDNIKINSINEKIFNQILSNVVSGRTDLKITEVNKLASEQMIGRLFAVKELIKELNLKNIKKKSLVIIESGKKKIISFDKKVSIGRLPANDICFDYNDVSSVHATINLDNDGIFIKDEFSTNGTFLNGEKIIKPEKIISGDIIQIASNASIALI